MNIHMHEWRHIFSAPPTDEIYWCRTCGACSVREEENGKIMKQTIWEVQRGAN